MKTLDEIISLFRLEDELAVALATGQPAALLNALSNRDDWKKLDIFAGLFPFPYPLLMKPNVHITSGYYGPIERFLNDQGASIDYLPANFNGFETYALKKKPRVLAATVSSPDKDGFVTFGTHGAAIYKPFVEALKNKNQIAIAEINPTMPVVYGHSDFGDNKIHINDIEFAFEQSSTQMEMPEVQTGEVEKKIAENIASLIDSKSTLQFGIGGIPNLLAEMLALSNVTDLGIHSELVSDGFLKLWEAGKISNRHKGLLDGQSVFTFAFGSQNLYQFLDERNGKNRRQAICLPVSFVNSPHIISQNKKFVSVNAGLMVDFAGQVCSEAIGSRQYSGVGGQLSFVQGAYETLDGKSIISIKSTATVNGKRVSNIVPTLPAGSVVSTPRHFTQYIVTEFGVADLYGISDERRPEKLVQIAHPDFRDELKAQFEEMKRLYYKN